MADYVFSLGLIPIQEWIAQARRSRDLRAGSVFLWHAMAKLLARLAGESTSLRTVEIWTPEPPPRGFEGLAHLSFQEALREPYGIPNRASGWCSAESDERVQEVFQALERELAAVWKSFRDPGMERLRMDASGSGQVWSRLKPHWEAYQALTAEGEDLPVSLVWAARPAPYPRQQRKDNLEAAYALFSDVKRSRPARRWPLGRPVGKCTQCGQREAVGPERSFEAWLDWYSRWAEDPWIEQGYRLDAGERLCFVCLAKRAMGYEERRDFPSTGEIAARRWLQCLQDLPGPRELVARLRRTRLGEEDLGRVLHGPDDGMPEEVVKIRSALRQAIERHNLTAKERISPRPPSYLALIAFDGDDMGRRVVADPHGVPKAMAEFARTAAGLLTKHRAEPFYLAGDEGLAMAPTEEALALALALRTRFAEAFEGLTAEEIGAPTLSAGIAFFEHGRPMRGAILAARAALEEAKALEGKDALGVVVETASGSRWDFSARWGDAWERIRAAAGLIAAGHLSPGWAYDAERFLETLPWKEWTPEVAAAARSELRRLFLRRVRVEGRTAEERRAARLVAWAALRADTWWPVDPYGVLAPPDPQQLHLIGFLARQGSSGAVEE